MNTLVILAAGHARRFGRLKQVEPVGPDGETLIECSINDACQSGFGRVVLVMQREQEAAIRHAAGAAPDRRIEIASAYQDSPAVAARQGRPWGTGHAVLCARDCVDGPFGVINADDYYGREAFAALAEFLSRPATEPPTYCLVGYALADTLPEHGAVSRAICECDSHGRLEAIHEIGGIARRGDGSITSDEVGAARFLKADACVSMNMWGFDSRVFALLAGEFTTFLRAHGGSADAEFRLPSAVGSLVGHRRAAVQVVRGAGQWCGLTHAADVEGVRTRLRALHRTSAPAAHTDAGVEPHMRHVLARFGRNDLIRAAPLAGGHIHRSYRVTIREAAGDADYVLQRFNTRVFPAPERVTENLVRVTSHVERRLVAEGVGEVSRRVLCPVAADDGRFWVRDAEQQCWRLTRFIPGTVTRETVRSARMAEDCAAAYGRFQRMLADWTGPALHETLPDFHDTPKRFEAFDRARAADACGRAAGVRAEIDAVLARRTRAGALLDLQARGLVPRRIVHNDAKAANVLFDADTMQPLCVIDLDTVMPGLSLYDFGDMVRSMTCAGSEDDADASTIEANPALFEALARGYLAEAGPMLTAAERAHLVAAGQLITLEQAVRFLTDHLAGDAYYAVARPDHNLARCRTQLALLDSLERRAPELSRIVRSVS